MTVQGLTNQALAPAASSASMTPWVALAASAPVTAAAAGAGDGPDIGLLDLGRFSDTPVLTWIPDLDPVTGLSTGTGLADAYFNTSRVTVMLKFPDALKLGDQVQVKVDDGVWQPLLLPASAVGLREWKYVDPRTFPDGTVTHYEVRVQDLAGNIKISNPLTVAVDRQPPTTTVDITGIHGDSGDVDDFITNDTDGLTVEARLSAALTATEQLLYSRDNGKTWAVIDAVHEDPVTHQEVTVIDGTTVRFFDAGLTSTATIQMRVMDLAKNQGPFASQEVIIDTEAPLPPELTIDPIADDDIINVKESQDDVVITGTIAGLPSDVSKSTLLVTVGGKSHEVTDIKDTAAGIVWSVAVSGDVLASDDTVTATLEVTDKAGNSSAPVSETRDYAVALDPPTVEITLPIAGDNWVNAEEQDEVKLSGTTVNVAKDREVTLRISDANSATADVIATAQVDANGNWSTLSLDLSGLDDGALVVKADVSDNAGNTASDQETIDKDVKGPTTAVTIESISIDSGSQNDFVTNDNDGLTINAKLTAPLAPGERLQYSSGGDIWEDITSSVNGMAVIHDDPKLTSTATIQMRTVDEHGNLGAADSQLVTIDTLRAVNDVGEAGIGLATVVDDVDRILGESSRSIARGGVPGNAKAYAQGAWLAPITFTVEEGGQMKVAIEASIKTEVPILEQHLTIYVKNEKGQTVATIEYKDPLWEGGSWYNGLPIGPDAKILTLGAGTYAVEAVYTDGWLLDAGAPANTARVSVTQMSLATKVVDIETAEGNILTNDSLGVSFDSLKVAGAGSSGFQDVVNQDTKVRGEFGTLTIDPDGAYEYTLDVDPTVSAAAAVAALAGKTDVFQSELMRADGSYETASLSIEIMNLLDQAAQPPFGLPW